MWSNILNVLKEMATTVDISKRAFLSTVTAMEDGEDEDAVHKSRDLDCIVQS